MIIVILDNIRSVYNVGSIFRTCDGAGVEKIYLCGTTPTPLDRFGRVRKDLAKVALGAEKTVPWEYTKTTEEAIESLKAEGVRVVAVEQSPSAISYKTFKQTSKIAFVFGNETDGVSKQVLDMCDTIVEIPMHGAKESLNVSVVAGIILFAHTS
ncbi:MAG: RNA methyltransferase [Candidatus Pacebacteria bacterium]|nr:RNA methyltransferase [Candidatus Paceibacterota bacterium]